VIVGGKFSAKNILFTFEARFNRKMQDNFIHFFKGKVSYGLHNTLAGIMQYDNENV
jgi:hypothetical protein